MLGLTLTFAVDLQAQTPPYAPFQNAVLTGGTNTLTVTRLPVVTAQGILYKNLTLMFDVDVTGNITLAPDSPKITASPNLVVSKFKPGKYAGPATVYRGDFAIQVAGPGVAAGGATEWTATTPQGGDTQTYPGTATWYVGPLATNPLSGRLKAAGITSTAWSYGVSSSAWGAAWPRNGLIGVSQVGNTITFVSFSTYVASGKNQDYNEPVDQITYTLVP